MPGSSQAILTSVTMAQFSNRPWISICKYSKKRTVEERFVLTRRLVLDRIWLMWEMLLARTRLLQLAQECSSASLLPGQALLAKRSWRGAEASKQPLLAKKRCFHIEPADLNRAFLSGPCAFPIHCVPTPPL